MHRFQGRDARRYRRAKLAGANLSTRLSTLAGKPAPSGLLVDVPRLVTAYYSERPDPAVPTQRVAFGTSGHRGSAFENSFNEAHVLAISQAICAYRKHKASTARCFSASTPMRCPRRRSPARWRCWPRTASR